MSVYFLIVVMLLVFSIFALELYRKKYTYRINHVFNGESLKKLPSLFLISRIVLVIFLILFIVVPVIKNYYKYKIINTEAYTYTSMALDKDFYFSIEHNRLPLVIDGRGPNALGVMYKFEIQMDLLELADAISEDMNNDYEYYVVDKIVYFNMESYYVKLTKTKDSKYWKDEYVIYIDCVNLNEPNGTFELLVPFPITTELQAQPVELTEGKYQHNLVNDKEFYLEYYATLEDAIIDGNAVTLEVLNKEYNSTNETYEFFIYTIKITFEEHIATFEIINSELTDKVN